MLKMQENEDSNSNDSGQKEATGQAVAGFDKLCHFLHASNAGQIHDACEKKSSPFKKPKHMPVEQTFSTREKNKCPCGELLALLLA